MIDDFLLEIKLTLLQWVFIATPKVLDKPMISNHQNSGHWLIGINIYFINSNYIDFKEFSLLSYHERMVCKSFVLFVSMIQTKISKQYTRKSLKYWWITDIDKTVLSGYILEQHPHNCDVWGGGFTFRRVSIGKFDSLHIEHNLTLWN